MSEWFRSIPSALENVAYAAKVRGDEIPKDEIDTDPLTQFQHDAMASQLRYHSSRHQQLRQMLEKLKREMFELKRLRTTLALFGGLTFCEGQTKRCAARTSNIEPTTAMKTAATNPQAMSIKMENAPCSVISKFMSQQHLHVI